MITREKTNALLDLIETGVLTSDHVLNLLLDYLSEYDVADFYEFVLRDYFDNEDL